MKKIPILAAAAVLLLSSCSKKGVESESKESEAKVYKISLGFTGDLTVGEESPLSSLAPKTVARSVSATNDLIGIQVRSRAKGSSSSYNPYAYGLFDDIANVSISLLGGYEYSFEATMIKDGKSKIHSNVGSYSTPFYRAGTEFSGSPIGTGFTISSNTYFSTLKSGSTMLASNSPSIFEIPETDRYYGIVPVYEPSANGTLNLAMSRASFGAKFVATGLTSGRLRISIKNAPDQYIEVNTPNKTIQNIYTFSCVSCAASDNVYSETIPVTVSWLRTDGAVVPIATKDITFKRKTLTTINISVADGSLAKAINITQESGDMVNGETVSM